MLYGDRRPGVNSYYTQQCGRQISHEAAFKQQPEQQAARVRPPEGTSYWEPPLLQGLQLFLLAFAAEEASSARTLSHRTTENT